MKTKFKKHPTPKVSIILPVYNAEATISDCINSIINQTFKEFELITMDDGSIDRSLEIIDKLAKLDNRIIVITQKNVGLSKTLNKAIELSKGKYIARMDSDDISHIDRLKNQYEYLERNQDIDLISCNYQKFYEIENKKMVKLDCVNHPTEHSSISKLLCFCSPICHPGVFAKKTFFEDCRYSHKCIAEDHELWFRGLAYKKKYANIDKSLILYRISKNSLTKKNKILIRLTSLFMWTRNIPLSYELLSKDKFTKKKMIGIDNKINSILLLGIVISKVIKAIIKLTKI